MRIQLVTAEKGERAEAFLAANAGREEYELMGPVDEDVDIIFARPWYPGYRATLDGRPLPLTPYRRFLPEVTLPKGATGRLVVEYRPAGLDTGLKIAAGAGGLLLLWMLAGLFLAKTREQTAAAPA